MPTVTGIAATLDGAAATLVRIEQEMGAIDRCYIQVPNESGYLADVVAANKTVDVTYGGATIWNGVCRGGQIDDKSIIALAYSGPLDTCSSKLFTAPYTGATAIETIFAAIAAAAGVTVHYLGPTTTHYPIVSFDKTTCFNAIRFLAESIEYDFYVLAASPTHIHIGIRGTDYSADTLVPINTSTRTVDKSRRVDTVYVRGIIGNVVTYGTATDGSGIGQTAVYNDNYAKDVAALNAKAAKLLAESQSDTFTTTIDLPINIGQKYNPGDTVTINSAKLGYASVACKIFKVIKTLGIVTLEVDSLSPNASRVLAHLTNLSELGISFPTPLAMQNWSSDIVISAIDYNTANWAAGTIKFADDSTQAINAGTTGNLAAGVHFLYFTIGSATMAVTAAYGTAVSSTTAIFATLYVSTDITQMIGINAPFSLTKPVVNADLIAVDAVYAASMQPGVQPFESDIEFFKDNTAHGGVAHNAIHWHAGTITFADTSTLAIIAGQKTGMADGSTWYIYFTVGSNALSATTTYSVTTGNTVGLLCKAYVSSAVEVQDVAFHTIGAKFQNFNADFIGAKSINTLHLTADSIYGKDIATAASVGVTGGEAGIRIIGDAALVVGNAIGDAIGGNFTAGIWGFLHNPALVPHLRRTFYLDPTTGNINVYGDGSFALYTDANVLVGYINMYDGGAFDVMELEAIDRLYAHGNSVMIADDAAGGYISLPGTGNITTSGEITSIGNIIPNGTNSYDLGSSTYKWRYLYAINVLAATRLNLPQKTSDGSPSTGDIWLRTDL